MIFLIFIYKRRKRKIIILSLLTICQIYKCWYDRYMTKILLISDNKQTKAIIQSSLLSYDFIEPSDGYEIVDILKAEAPDIVMIDTDSSFDYKNIYRQIKDFQIIKFLIMGDKPVPQDILSDAHLFVSNPINKDLLEATVSVGLKTRKSLIKLSKSNQELANSLYQLNVLYNTSSQFAGSLSRNKLIDIMNDGIDKSLNSNISCTLSFKDDRTPVLIINSNCKLSERLVEALKMRAVLNYKNSGIYITEMFTIDDIEVEQIVKYSINEYDFEILNFNKLISYIILDDKCYGYSEIFREKEFTSDDEKFFKTLVNQITQPLKNAILYQEIARLERLKSEFISIVSHELKTPLTSIKNSFDIISGGKTGEVTEPMKKFLDMASQGVSILIHRGKELFLLNRVPTETRLDKETLRQIERARQQFEKGETIAVNTRKELNQLLNSL